MGRFYQRKKLVEAPVDSKSTSPTLPHQAQNNHRSYKITSGKKPLVFGKCLVGRRWFLWAKINFPGAYFFNYLIIGGLSRVVGPLAE